jgi:endonuclease V-like protein UPF0215 family
MKDFAFGPAATSLFVGLSYCYWSCVFLVAVSWFNFAIVQCDARLWLYPVVACAEARPTVRSISQVV